MSLDVDGDILGVGLVPRGSAFDRHRELRDQPLRIGLPQEGQERRLPFPLAEGGEKGHESCPDFSSVSLRSSAGMSAAIARA
jgi:hypothetical protein